MSEIDELKQSAERLSAAAKESAERLSAAAKETAEIGVQVLRDQIHGIVKDPNLVARMREVEEAFDRQVAEATRQIEDGAKQLMNFWGGVLNQSQPPASRPQPTRVEVEVEPKKGDK